MTPCDRCYVTVLDYRIQCDHFECPKCGAHYLDTGCLERVLTTCKRWKDVKPNESAHA